jgi:hypothetical protein
VDESARHHGNIVYKLAGTDPAAAERVLQRVPLAVRAGPTSRSAARDDWVGGVWRRLAAADLPRARRLADRLGEPYLKALAYGGMAYALAPTNRTEATGLLRQAVDGLSKQSGVEQDRSAGSWNSAVTACLLVPAAERIEPALAREVVARALSFRIAPAGADRPGSAANAALAVVLARHDRAAARWVLEPALRRIATQEKPVVPVTAFAAAALIDPAWAVRLAETQPTGRTQDEARLVVARFLTLEGSELWREAGSLIGVWSVEFQGF